MKTVTTLKRIRENLGISQAELARRINVSRASVNMAEKKGLRNICAAQRYARALNCNPLDLIEL